MKKFIMFLILLMFVFSFSVVNATENDDAIYIESYEEYLKLLEEMSGGDEAKAGYIEGIFYNILYDVPTTVYKAKVKNASEATIEYGVDESNAYYMSRYQGLEIEVLEGDFKGQTFEDCIYPLKVDTYSNIDVSMVNEGDIIYVSFYESDDGVFPYVTQLDASVSRWLPITILGIVTVLLALVYTGKHGVKLLLPTILIVDLLFIVFADFMLNYFNVWVVASATIVLIAIAFFALKLGVNSKLGNALISLVAVLVVMTVIIYGFDYISNIAGVSYESASLVEDIVPMIENGAITPTVNFHSLSIALTVLMMAFAVIPMITKKIEMMETKSTDSEEMKKYLSEKIILVVGILLVAMLQKYFVVYMNSARFEQVFNSEMLIIEVSRIMFVVLGMSIAPTVTEMVTKTLEDK